MSDTTNITIVTSLSDIDGLDIAPIRNASSTPMDLRIAVYPDGREVLQKAVMWSCGAAGGLEWVDVERVAIPEKTEA